MRVYILSALLIWLGTSISFAQEQSEEGQVFKGAEKGELIYLGKSKPLSELDVLPRTDEMKRAAARKNKVRLIPNFTSRKTPSKVNENALPKGADPIAQTQVNINRMPTAPEFNAFEGLDQFSGGAGVPDTDGAIGKNHYIQVVNVTFFQIFDKEGNALNEPTAFNSFWSQFGASSGGDPIILYDQEAERWIFTEFGPPFGLNQMLVAISETDDPFGSYHAYQFVTQQFPDYPKYAIWDDAYVITTNEAGAGSLAFYVMEKNAMLAGEPDAGFQRLAVPGIANVPGFFTLTPLNWSGANRPPENTPPMLWRLHDDAWGNTQSDRLEYFTINNIDWDNAFNTTWSGPFFVDVAPFDSDPCSIFQPFSFACVPQPNGQGIDAIPLVIMNQMHYRNFGSHESIVLNFVVDVTGNNRSGIRWMELRKNGIDWEVYQEGTFGPDDGLDRFIGAIAMDASGNIGLAYNVSSLTKEPSLRFTGRRSGDPLGTMTMSEIEFGTGTGSSNTDRYGDYANMAVDPENDRTFWFTGEYQKFTNFWGTKILSFTMQRDTNDLAVTNLVSPQSAADLTNAEVVMAEIKNEGINTQSNYHVGLVVNGELIAFEEVSTPIAADETYKHTFSTNVDMSEVGDYSYHVFTSLDADSNKLNDTLITTVRNIPHTDVRITEVAQANGGITFCGDTASLLVSLVNDGVDTISALTIAYQLNGGDVVEIPWNGMILQNEVASINLIVGPLMNGENTLDVNLISPNGVLDELPDNNALSFEIDTDLEAGTIIFELNLDDFPDETTWQLIDSKGMTLFSGGPYDGLFGETISEIWCLNPDSCYVFQIFDAFGDGLNGEFVDGSYEILDGQNRPITELQNINFGFGETNEFCAQFTCRLDASVQVTPVTEPGLSNGAIIIQTQNAGEPIEYSLDGQQFVSSSFFSGLTEGTYTYYVRDGYGCVFQDSFIVALCDLVVDPLIIGVSQKGASDGSIEMLVDGGNGNLEYSINNGLNFQSSPIFTNLPEGSYNILVRDEAGCSRFIFNIVVDVAVSVIDNRPESAITISPNPSSGIYQIEISGFNDGPSILDYDIFDATGKHVTMGRIGKFNSDYKGPVSIVNEPTGIYFLKFKDERMTQVYRLVKE